MAPHSSTLAWKIPWMEEPGGLQSMGSIESDTTEQLHFHFSLSRIGEGNGNLLQCSCLENPRDGKPGGLLSMGSHSRTWLKQRSSSSLSMRQDSCSHWSCAGGGRLSFSKQFTTTSIETSRSVQRLSRLKGLQLLTLGLGHSQITKTLRINPKMQAGISTLLLSKLVTLERNGEGWQGGGTGEGADRLTLFPSPLVALTPNQSSTAPKISVI